MSAMENELPSIVLNFDCADAGNRKRLNNLLESGGTGELIDVSTGSFHWMFGSDGEHVVRKSLT